MTREEEITEMAREMYPAGAQNSLQFRTGFCTGAEWADQHPRKGLWDAQKVIEWLNSVDFSKYVEDLSVVYVGKLKDDLIKAMEE